VSPARRHLLVRAAGAVGTVSAVGAAWAVGAGSIARAAGADAQASTTARASITERRSGTMDEAGGAQGVCVGRYGFAASAGIQPVSRAAMIYRVEASAHAEAPGDLLRLQAGTAEALRAADLGAGRQGLWVPAGGTRAGQRVLLGALPARGHTLLLKAVADAGREAPAEQLMRNVMDAYRAGVALGFCIGPGSITSEPSRNERASVTLKSAAAPGVELVAEIQTVAAPRDGHPLSDVEQEARALATLGTQLSVLRNAPRDVAGLAGHEGQVSTDNAREGAVLRYTWFHAGSAARADDPEILLRASAPAARRAQLDAAWAALLASFRRLPQPSR